MSTDGGLEMNVKEKAWENIEWRIDLKMMGMEMSMANGRSHITLLVTL